MENPREDIILFISNYENDRYNIQHEIGIYNSSDDPNAKGPDLMIIVTPDRGRNFSEKNAYFKVCSGTKYSDCKVRRFHLCDPNYVNHNGDRPNWDNMNTKDYKALKKALNSKCNVGEYAGMKVYDAIFAVYRDMYHIDIKQPKEMPDYGPNNSKLVKG